MGCHALLQGIFPTQGIELMSPALQDSLPAEPPGKPLSYFTVSEKVKPVSTFYVLLGNLLMFTSFLKNVFFFFLKFYLFIYSFLAVLGLCCCTGFSSSCKWGLPSTCSVQTSHCCDFSCCGAQALGHASSSSCSSCALECRLSCCGVPA